MTIFSAVRRLMMILLAIIIDRSARMFKVSRTAC